MREYNIEQLETLSAVKSILDRLSSGERQRLSNDIADYLSFRNAVAEFSREHFSALCTQKCFENELSACCSREGIITFFADVVINTLVSDDLQIERLMKTLRLDKMSNNCVYLGPKGCLWEIKPIICEMFLCDSAKGAVFRGNPAAEAKWKAYKQMGKTFKWPDHPVLFDELETYFMKSGIDSPLMYLHKSPGLLRVKKRSGRTYR